MYWMVRFLKLCDQVNKCHCLIYVFLDEAHVQKKLDKLYPHAMKCVFLWYTEGVKCYRLWLKRNMVIAYCSTRLWKLNEMSLFCMMKCLIRKLRMMCSVWMIYLNINLLGICLDMIVLGNLNMLIIIIWFHLCSMYELLIMSRIKRYIEIWIFFWIGLMLCVKKWTFCVWAKFGLFSWFQMGVSRVLSKQRAYIIYWEIFLLLLKFTTVYNMLALVAHHKWKLKQMDVNS